VEDYNNQFQDLAVADTVTTDTIILIIENSRGEDESFRTYAPRRARSFGYPNLREQQVEALEKLVKRKTDVILIAKTSFGKSLIFQLAPLLMADLREPGIALIPMPLTLPQQNQAENVKREVSTLERGVSC
jgi:ATP-dependent helicase YprA (DUF1998 family)